MTEIITVIAYHVQMRTLQPGRTQVNILKTRKREHSRKPDELYDIIESCSPGPYLELFARGQHSKDWKVWGDQSSEYSPSWPTYKNHSRAKQPSMFA